MKKEENKLTSADKEKSDERMREVIRKVSQDFDVGEGVEVILGSKDGSDKPKTISHFFTSRVPKLQIKSRNMQKTLEVEMSSVEEENQSLLHFLFKKSKN
jgi:hypothetical protein